MAASLELELGDHGHSTEAGLEAGPASSDPRSRLSAVSGQNLVARNVLLLFSTIHFVFQVSGSHASDATSSF